MKYRMRRADGAYRWAECRVEPRRDQEGAVVQWYGVSLDIDDEARAQEALRDRERELSLLVDMVPSHLWRLTPGGETEPREQRMATSSAWMSRTSAGWRTAFDTIFHPDDADPVGDARPLPHSRASPSP